MQIVGQVAVVANLGVRHRQFTLCVETYDDGTCEVAYGYPFVALGMLVTHSIRCLFGDIRKGAKVIQTEEYIAEWRALIEQAPDFEGAHNLLAGMIFNLEIDTNHALWELEREQLETFYPSILMALPGEQDGKIRCKFSGGDSEQMFAALVLASQRGKLTVASRSVLPSLEEDELEQVALF